MKQILWFRRDLRITDNAILANACGEVLPIFIFDTNILGKLSNDDKRVTFIYQSVLKLKNDLQEIGLDLAIFYDTPQNVFQNICGQFDEVLCSCDFDSYAIARDQQIEQLIPMKRFYDSYLIHPNESLKSDGTPYKVFTPFYKSLSYLTNSLKLQTSNVSEKIKLYPCKLYEKSYTIEELGFVEQSLPNFLYQNPHEVLQQFCKRISSYEHDRDYINIDATSKMGVFLRFGTISAREVFNKVKEYSDHQFFIRELCWREFYNCILFYFPTSENENFNGKNINWEHNHEHFQAWCEGKTGVPIIDAAMRYFNQTGLMHNRLRMIVSSYLTKNLFIDWRWGESYFASKLLDYDASANIGSWQWAASTGADSVPYFRVFNPYLQTAKFDQNGEFIKANVPELNQCNPKLFSKENGVQDDIFTSYIPQLVSIKSSKDRAIQRFKDA